MGVGFLIFCFIVLIIIISEGIIIYYLLKNNLDKDYGNGELAEKIPKLRNFWGPFVVYVIATSVITLFIASFVQDKNITLYDMNTWVSFILGMVALIIGIISLFLSFYNVDQSIQSQKDSLNIMNSVKDDIGKQLRDLKSGMDQGFNKLHDDINGRVETYKVDDVSENEWKEDE